MNDLERLAVLTDRFVRRVQSLEDVGLVGLGLATYFYLTRPTRTTPAAPLFLAPSRTGALIGYTSTF